MDTITVSLPDALLDFVESQVGEHGYGTNGEYVRDLIRRDQARHEMRGLILDGMLSGPGLELDGDYFDRLHARVRNAETGAG